MNRQTKQQFIPVSERMPDKKGDYVCRIKKENGNIITLKYHYSGLINSFPDERVTHWLEYAS